MFQDIKWYQNFITDKLNDTVCEPEYLFFTNCLLSAQSYTTKSHSSYHPGDVVTQFSNIYSSTSI